MDHPLDDARLKIAGAKQDLDSLDADIVTFSESNPYKFRLKGNMESGEHHIDFGKPPALPRKWGLELGHIGGDLRSALEYLVAVLIREAKGKVKRQNGFPIAKTKAEYLKVRKGITYRDQMLLGVPERFRKKIDGFQPYHRGDLAFRDPLALLAEINNPDKHHTLQTAYSVIDLPTHWVRLPTSDPIEKLTIHFRLPQEISVEAKMKRKRGPDAMAIEVHPKMQVDPGRIVDIQIVFGAIDPRVLVSLFDLREIILRVEEIVESFA